MDEILNSMYMKYPFCINTKDVCVGYHIDKELKYSKV